MLDAGLLDHLLTSVQVYGDRLDVLDGGVSRADEFDEGQHPRGADGKFTTAGGGGHAVAQAYQASLKGKKGSVAGLIKYMIMAKVPEGNIFQAAQELYGLGVDKKGYVKWYHKDLQKSGATPPELVKGVEAPSKAEEKTTAEPDIKAMAKAAGLFPETKPAGSPSQATLDLQKSIETDLKENGMSLTGISGTALKHVKAALAAGDVSKLPTKLQNPTPMQQKVNDLINAAAADLLKAKLSGTASSTTELPNQTSPNGTGIFGVDLADNHTVSQKNLVGYVKGLSPADAKAKIEEKMADYGNPDNVAFAKKLLTALEGQRGAPSAAPGAVPNIPEVLKNSHTAAKLEGWAKDPSSVTGPEYEELYKTINDFHGGPLGNYAQEVATYLEGKTSTTPGAIPNIPEGLSHQDEKTAMIGADLVGNPHFDDAYKLKHLKAHAENASAGVKPYLQQLVAHQEAKMGVTAPGATPPVPESLAKSKWAEEAFDIANDKTTTTDEKLTTLANKKTWAGSIHQENYVGDLIDHLKGSSPTTEILSTEAPKPKAPVIPASTHALLDKVSKFQATKANSKAKLIKAALALPTVEEQAVALHKLYPKTASHNVSALKVVDELKKLQEAYKPHLPATATNVSGTYQWQPATATPPKPTSTPAVAAHKVSDTTADDYAHQKVWLGKALDANKPALQAKHDELKAALNHPTAEAQLAAVDALQPIANPTGLAQKGFNEHIAKVKADYGIKVGSPPTASLPKGPPPPLQNAVYHAAKAAPHHYIDKVTKHEVAPGVKVKARLRADTENIPGDHYAKVTAAYGNSEDGMSQAVDQAMENYASSILNKFSSDQLSALQSYQNSGYGDINSKLLSDPKAALENSKKAKLIQQAIANAYVPANTPVFRGVTASLKTLTGFDDPQEAVGRAFEHKNFASCSRNIGTSKKFGDKTLLKFTIPAGTNGWVMEGQNGGEREIVLGARSMFKVDKVEQTVVGGNVKHLIHCTYLGQREDD